MRVNKIDHPSESSVIGAGLLWAALVMPVLSGCEQAPAIVLTPEARLAQVIAHGEGVYEFDANKEFPKTLADFRRAHKNERIVSVTQGLDYRDGVTNSSVGLSGSFIVVTEPNTK